MIKKLIQNEAAEISQYLADVGGKESTNGMGRRKSWSAGRSDSGEGKYFAPAKALCHSRSSKENSPRPGSSSKPDTAAAYQHHSLASLAERTRKEMVDTLQSESKRAEDDIKRLKSILKVDASNGDRKPQDRAPDPETVIPTVSAAPAKVKSLKAKAPRTQSQEVTPEAASNKHNTCDDCEDSSTGAITANKATQRKHRKHRPAKPVDNFGNTAVSTFQAGSGVRNVAKHGDRRRDSVSSAISAKSRASAASRKKRGQEVVLDTVQSVKQLQLLLHQESDGRIDSSNITNQESVESKESLI
jgi:hypothetical protein